MSRYPGALVYASIDQAALEHNVRTLRSRLGAVELMAVVKANAYGHQLDCVVPALVRAGVTRLGVATVPEALELTDLLTSLGVQDTVRTVCWLFGPHTDLTAALSRGVELGLPAPWAVDAIAAAAREAGTRARVHVKVDTGLGRNGLTQEQFEAVLARLPHTPGVEIAGVMTHLANADEPEDEANRSQIEHFAAACAQVRELLRTHPELEADTELETHAMNSPATLTMEPAPGTTARVGVAVYGLSPLSGTAAGELGLRPVMTLHSEVITVKDVPAGHGASYGLGYRAPQDTRFALIAGGYGDGIPRGASGKAQVSIRGRRYPVVGRIAMDQMIVDLGAQARAEVKPGDEVIVWGPGGPSADEWAAWTDSINYEIVTRLAARVDRIPTGGGHGSAAGGTPGSAEAGTIETEQAEDR